MAEEEAAAPVVKSESTSRLINEYEAQMVDVRNRAKVWSKHLEDYNQLKETLKTISDRVVHSATMIPMGKKAYMEGTLVHTNEIMVLLGDNWFAERSAKQAGELCQRRIDKCTEMLEKLDQELTLIESWNTEASNLSEEQQQEVDIREPFDEEAEKEWAKEHRRKMKDFRATAKQTETSVDDDALFRRLDELEIEEELDEHLKKEAERKDDAKVVEKEENGSSSSSSSSEDWSESPPLSDEEEQDPDDAVIDAAIEAAEEEARKAANESRYNTVPDRTNVRRVSRFSVSEIISEREVLDLPVAAADSSSSSFADDARRDHMAQLKPRPRRVSFGSISERLFLTDDEKQRHDSSQDVDVPTIYFSHQVSDRPVEIVDRSDAKVPQDPSDLVRLYGSGSPTKLKSILKPSGSSHSLSSFEEESSSSSIGRFAVSPTKPVPPSLEAVTSGGGRFKVSPSKIPDPLAHPVKETVVESVVKAEEQQEAPASSEPRKQSRFKLSRVQL